MTTQASAVAAPLALADLTDVSTITIGPDGGIAFDLTGRVLRGAQAAAEQVLRSWATPRGALTWAPDQGEDITRLENATAGAGMLARWRARLAAQAKRANGFVRACAVSIGYDAPTRTFAVTGALTFTDGSSAVLDVAISQASGAILSIARRLSA